MAAKMKIGASFTCVSSFPSSSVRNHSNLKLNSRLRMFGKNHLNVEQLRSTKAYKPLQLVRGEGPAKEVSLKWQSVISATSEDQQSTDDDYELSDSEEEEVVLQPLSENETTSSDSYHKTEGAEGKPGFISFYGHKPVRKDDPRRGNDEKSQKNRVLWLVCPTILVASFVFPSLYLRRLISTIFEDSLLTDFLILFFTEAMFYSGAAVSLYLVDRLHRPTEPVPSPTAGDPAPQSGHRASSVAVLALSLTIPMVTMGFVWPWTGPAASATLAPYLVGIVVQFAFERYARYVKSPSWPAIPVIFQVYRLHQLNRAAQLVTALSFTVRGAEMTSHNVAINGSLSTLLNVLQFLGVVCIWSLSSFVIRFLPSTSAVELRR